MDFYIRYFIDDAEQYAGVKPHNEFCEDWDEKVEAESAEEAIDLVMDAIIEQVALHSENHYRAERNGDRVVVISNDDNEVRECYYGFSAREAIWYAVLNGDDDDDWGYGSVNFEEAKEMAKNQDEGYIAIIDERSEPMCIVTISREELGFDNCRYCVGAYIQNGNIQIIDSDISLEDAKHSVEYYKELDRSSLNQAKTEYVILNKDDDENLWHKVVG